MTNQDTSLIEKNRIRRSVKNLDDAQKEILLTDEPPKEEDKKEKKSQKKQSKKITIPPSQKPQEESQIDKNESANFSQTGMQPAGTQMDTGGIDPKSQRLLLKITSVFPFQFFPDELIVDEMKITYVNKLFFLSRQTRIILINNISSVIVETSPFFAALKIRQNDPREHEFKITYLKKSDAIKAQKIIEGLIISRAQAIPIDKLNQKQLENKIEDLGTVPEVEEHVNNS